MTARPWRQLLASSLVPTLLAAGLSLYRPGWLASLERGIYDTMLRAVSTHPPTGRIVIVDIDEQSLATIGQWPWRRDVVARLIRELRNLGASVVALDIVFAEADRYQTPEGMASDDLLAQTLKGGRVVLGYAMTFDPVAKPAPECVRHALGMPIVRDAGTSETEPPFFHATKAICNLAALTEAAGGSGFLNAAPDPDGILRRAPLLMELNGRVYPSLAVAVVKAATNVRDTALNVVNVNMSRLALDTHTVPLDGKSNLLLRYRGRKRTFPYVSAVDVLTGKANAETFADKITLIGTTALGTREVVATPLDTLFAGVEVQATIADNLLRRDFIFRPEHGVALETQVALVAGLLCALAVGWFGLSWGALVMTACLAVIWIGAAWMMSSGGGFLSPLFPTIGLVGSLAAMTVARYATERRHAIRAEGEKSTSQRLMVRTLLSLTETRDADTGRHSRRTERYARALANALAANARYRPYLTTERIDLFASLAPIHDIGKVGIPDRLLNKPGSLTAEELEEMRRHPGYGRDVIVRAQHDAGAVDDEILTMAKEIVHTHHEKWDGTGYPQGLRGTEIPVVGRMMAVVDVYDAMMTRRAYQAPLTHDVAVERIAAGRGTHFDPDVVEAFLHIAADLGGFSKDGDR